MKRSLFLVVFIFVSLEFFSQAISKIIGPPPTVQNGDKDLGAFYTHTACGLDYTLSSIVLSSRINNDVGRGRVSWGQIVGQAQPASMGISGIPAGATIVSAFAWWSASTVGAQNTTITIQNPGGSSSSFSGTIVGRDGDKCWGTNSSSSNLANPPPGVFDSTITYRANITSIVTTNGNYNISGLPTGVLGANIDVDGVTIIVIYTDPADTDNGTIVLADGAFVSNLKKGNCFNYANDCGSYLNYRYLRDQLTASICTPPISAKGFVVVSDMQFPDTTINLPNSYQQKVVIAGAEYSVTPKFLNVEERAINTSSLSCGSNSLTYGVITNLDCYNFQVMGFFFKRAGCSACPISNLGLTMGATAPSCSSPTGTASVTTTGGSGTLTYSWSNGATAQTATGLAAGTYTVVVSDASCNVSTSTVVVPPGSLGLSPNVMQPVSCGQTNGAINAGLSVTGTPPYTYNNGFTSNGIGFFTNLSAGSYTITVTDANNCSGTASIVLPAPSGCAGTCTITANATVVSNLTCNNNASGSATVTAANGTGAISYTWSSGVAVQTATGLSANTAYTVTVTDADNCTATSTVTLTEPPPIALVPGSTPTVCGGNTGTASVAPITGATYTWNSNPVQNTATATLLPSGTYTVTVVDGSNCSATATATVSNTGGLSIGTPTVTQPTCAVPTGTIALSPSGGGTYTYAWSASAVTTSSRSGLAAGGYTITVTDGSPCSATTAVVINSAPAGFTLTPSSTATACGGSTGTVSVTATGATGVLTYTWSNALGSASGYTGVGAGTYTVTVTDGSGCTNSATATVGNTTGLSIGTPTVTQPTCAVPTGTIALSPSGGGTYTYAWSASAVTASSRSGLATGGYTITVTDGSPCSATTAVVINAAPAGFTLTPSSTATACGGNTGTVSVTATGATGVLTYTWSNALGSASGYTGVGIGTYTVTVADGSGCSATATTTVGNTTGLSIGTPTVTQPTCAVPTGTIALSPSGGGTYTYAWSGSAVTASSRSGLAAGSYTITVTDGSPCSATTAVVINAAPTAFTLSTSTTPSSSCTTSNGTASVTVTPAVGTYTYAWSGGLGAASAVTGLAGGTYSVTVSDGAGCSVSTTAIVSQVGSNLSVTTSSVNALCTAQNGSATAIPAGSSGYTYSWSSVPVQTTAVATSLGAGTYTVVVTDGGGCIVNATAVVGTSNGNIIINSNPTPSACGGSTGAAVANPIGGSTPYSYIWSSGATVQTATALAAGIYSVTVTDASGCSATTAVNVNSNGGLSVAATATSATCSLANGSVTATPSTGTPGPYTFTWMPGGASTQTVTGLAAGNYTVTFTNGGGCPAGTASVAVGVTNTTGFVDFTLSATEATIVSPSFSFNSTSTNLQNWNWNFGDGSGTNSTDLNPSYTYTDTGRYCIKLIGINTDGCIDSATKCVYIKPEFSLFIPNAFSPNKDGKNEVFLPKGFNVRKFKMMVFDRWGELIYVSEDFLKGWDGKANNGDEIAQQDVYTYIITADDPTGKKYRYIGHITLVK